MHFDCELYVVYAWMECAPARVCGYSGISEHNINCVYAFSNASDDDVTKFIAFHGSQQQNTILANVKC